MAWPPSRVRGGVRVDITRRFRIKRYTFVEDDHDDHDHERSNMTDMNQRLREGFGRGKPPRQEAPAEDKSPRDMSVEELVGARRQASDRFAELVDEVEVRLVEETPAEDELEEGE